MLRALRGAPRAALMRALAEYLPLPQALHPAVADALVDGLESAGFAIVRRPVRPPKEPKRERPPKPPASFPKPARREDPDRCPEHLRWIRTLPCAVPGCGVVPCEAAHVRVNTGGGMGKKPPDRWVVSLCVPHHREQHQIGHRAFDEEHGIEMRRLAEQFAAASPHLK